MKIRHNGNLQVGLGDDYDSNTGEVSNERRIYEFEPEADGTWSFLGQKFYEWDFSSEEPLPFATASDNRLYLAAPSGRGIRRVLSNGTEDVVSPATSNQCLQGQANAWS